ncbi:TrmB family transcriptional regulator [Bacteroidota bacterium]
METREALKGLGLGDGEIKVYLALLKLGSVPVSKIKEETNLHRTTIYDFIEKLLNKGLVNYVVKENSKHFKATNPSILLNLVKEKEDRIKKILPDLMKLVEFEKEDINVEIYKGREGFKAILNDMMRVKKNLVFFGVDETKFKERFPHLIEQHFRNEEKYGMKERLLTSEKTKFMYTKKTAHYRYIPEEYFNPTPTGVYGDIVIIIIWEPFSIIRIQNSQLADSYKKHFEMLWKMAKDF